MRICVLTRYRFHEATYAAYRLTDLLRQLGHEVFLPSLNYNALSICPTWDRQLQQLTWEETLRQTDAVLWTHVPTLQEITLANQHAKLTCVLPMWHEISSGDRKSLQRAAVVACPHMNFEPMLAEWRRIAASYIPWDCGLPITQRNSFRTAGSLHVLIAWYDQMPHYTEPTFFDELMRLLELIPELHFTLAYSARQVSRSGNARVRGLARRYGSRFVVQRSVPPPDRAALYAKHDLTVWPTFCENIGIVGLESLTMGTPLVTWYVPPVNEFADAGAAVAVPCALRMNDLGAIWGEDSIYRFSLALQEVLQNPQQILQMQQCTATNLHSRREDFTYFWKTTFDD